MQNRIRKSTTKRKIPISGGCGAFEWSTPEAGDIIPGSGGCRKLRWAAKGRGKRGGACVIYYWITDDHRILLLDLYAKNESKNLSPAQLKELKRKKP